MKRLTLILLIFVFYVGCASQPSASGGNGGGSSSSSSSGETSSTPGSSSSTGIVISQTDGAETIETIPDLKLKLKDLPDSLSDESLKLKLKSVKGLVFDSSDFFNFKYIMWVEVARVLQKESVALQVFTSTKEYAKTVSMPVGQTTTLVASGVNTNKVYVKTDGSGGLEYYFSVTGEGYFGDYGTNQFTSKIYMHVYPTNGKAAVELISEGTSANPDIPENYIYSYYNEVTKERFDALIFKFPTGGYSVGNFWKIIPDSSIVKIIIISGDNPTYVAYGDNDKGAITYADPDSGTNYEYYNGDGAFILQQNFAFGNVNNFFALKYMKLKSAYSNWQFVYETGDPRVWIFDPWEWNGTNIALTNTYYYYFFWIDTNGNKNFDDGEISIPMYNVEYYIWNTNYNMITPQPNGLLVTGDSTNYFDFTAWSVVESVKPLVDTFYNEVKNFDVINFVTNKTIPSKEYFPTF